MIYPHIVFYYLAKGGKYFKLDKKEWVDKIEDATPCFDDLDAVQAYADTWGGEVIRYYATCVPWREVET